MNLSLFIYLHRPLSRLYYSPIEQIPRSPPPPILTGVTGQNDRTYWLHTKKVLEAAETAIKLYTLPTPILQHSPLGICGIVIFTLANISACSHVLSGPEWHRTRDRIRLGLGGLKKFGEVWKIGERTEKETKKIAKHVFTLPSPDPETVNATTTGLGHDFELLGDDNLFAFEGLGQLDYMGLVVPPLWPGADGMM
jgi:hypothetical protein